jgi:hypothetical protein
MYQRTPLADTGRYLDPIGLREWPARIPETTWPPARDALREIAGWAAAHGARYLVVLVPTKYQASDTGWDEYRARWGLPDDALDRDHAQRFLRAFLEQEGIAFVDLLPSFRAAASPESLFFSVDAHWTPAGHRLAAAIVHRELHRRGWLTGDEPLPEDEDDVP